MLSRRRVLIGLGATFVLALAIVNVATGSASAVDMALYAAPFMAVVALLLSGRYVGEERILARLPDTAPPPALARRTPLAGPPRAVLQRRSRARAVVPARTARPRRRLNH